ncbi:MAG: hypothetical protein COB20_04025 [SAR86 cluster bacterium]|uniref:Uncharacterized protein n=1 Tax=SAR86 cluster bacterium TaxID=2030880 RepID=A0A2A4XB17_9GAMM|nr:MAG: hypothetical protein COB20_04025 [SAR86 cluster bacterium]
MVRALVVFMAGVALLACSEEGVSVDISNISDEARTCLLAANSMIDIAREVVNDSNSRPERRESRRVLMEDWVARLEIGEDPCSVYDAIGSSSTTF